MSKTYEKQLLALTPPLISFAPDSVPLGQIIAHSTTKNDLLVEKAMRHLAEQVPFQLGRWPSFTADVEGNYRVQARLMSIDIQIIERGQGRHGQQALSFVDAFYELMRLLAPKYSMETKDMAALMNKSVNSKFTTWLSMASLVKHMYEVNGFFGRRAASLCIPWMCAQLVRMKAYETMEEAISAENTLVHALRLGGLPEQQARDVYHEIVPQRMSHNAITQESIIVSQAAFNSADPADIVQSNVKLIKAQREAQVVGRHLSADALRSYYLDYFLTQLNEGGFARFVHDSGWDQAVVRLVRKGLEAADAQWHLQLFLRATKLRNGIDRRHMSRFLASNYSTSGDPTVQKVADIFNRFNDHFMAEEKTRSLLNYNAAWLRRHPQLVVLSDKEIALEFLNRVEAIPYRNQRSTQTDDAQYLRAQRLIRALCETGDHEPINLLSMFYDAEYVHNDQQLKAWYFKTDKGSYYMVDFGDRAAMFDTERDTSVCEIDAANAER